MTHRGKALFVVAATVVAAASGFVGVARVEAATAFTYTVNSVGDTNDLTLDDGLCEATCTLRSAIEQANVNCSLDPSISTTIRFAIPGTGVHTITPAAVTGAGSQNHPAALPSISCPVVLDGTSQGGMGYTGPPLIELDGSSATAQLAAGLAFGGNVNGSTVKGLIVNRWNGAGLQFTGKGGVSTIATFLVQGNYIGTDATGTTARPNQGDGIVVAGPATATIGGTTAGAPNLISGNANRGIFFGVSAATGATVQGNSIGTDVTGTRALPNAHEGIGFNGNRGAQAGGTATGAGNLISGNGGDGISVYGNVGAYQILGNRIGTQTDGATALGNAGSGISFLNTAGNDVVGGTGGGAANTIAFNGRAGVIIGLGNGHRVSGSSIFDNTGLGIDLEPCNNGTCPGVTPNDNGDADTGPNGFQNFPVLTQVTSTSSATTIKGTLNSSPDASFTVEVFSSPACDDSGNGEAKKYLGSASVTTVGNDGAFSLTVSPKVASGSALTATATSATGNTSELSACRSAPK